MIPALIHTAFRSLFVGSASASIVLPARPASLLEELQAIIQAKSCLPQLIVASIARTDPPEAERSSVPRFDSTGSAAFAKFRPSDSPTPPEPAARTIRAGRI